MFPKRTVDLNKAIFIVEYRFFRYFHCGGFITTFSVVDSDIICDSDILSTIIPILRGFVICHLSLKSAMLIINLLGVACDFV